MAQSCEQMNLSVDEVKIVGKALLRISDVIGTCSQMNTEISQSAIEQSSVILEVAAQVNAIVSISRRS
jgi:methyl-accepting chemotaxis protein